MAIFAAGIYLAVTGDRYAVLTGSSYVAGAAIIIVCGLITIATSVVGLVGAVGQFRWILLIVSLTTPSHCHPHPHTVTTHTHTHTHTTAERQVRVVHCLSVPWMQFSVIVALVIVLELAAGIYGFVRRNELVTPPLHTKYSAAC